MKLQYKVYIDYFLPHKRRFMKKDNLHQNSVKQRFLVQVSLSELIAESSRHNSPLYCAIDGARRNSGQLVNLFQRILLCLIQRHRFLYSSFIGSRSSSASASCPSCGEAFLSTLYQHISFKLRQRRQNRKQQPFCCSISWTAA